MSEEGVETADDPRAPIAAELYVKFRLRPEVGIRMSAAAREGKCQCEVPCKPAFVAHALADLDDRGFKIEAINSGMLLISWPK